MTPLEGGIPVEEGMAYGFSVYIKPAVAPVSLQLSLLWFDASGDGQGLISSTAGVIDLAESARTGSASTSGS